MLFDMIEKGDDPIKASTQSGATRSLDVNKGLLADLAEPGIQFFLIFIHLQQDSKH